MEIALGDNITALFVYTSTFFLLLRGPRCPEAMDAWDEWTRGFICTLAISCMEIYPCYAISYGGEFHIN